MQTLLRRYHGPRDVQSLCNTGAQRLSLRLTRAPNDSTGFVEKLNAPVPIFVDSKFSLRNTRIIDKDKSLSTNFFWWRSLGLCVDEHRCRIMSNLLFFDSWHIEFLVAPFLAMVVQTRRHQNHLLSADRTG